MASRSKPPFRPVRSEPIERRPNPSSPDPYTVQPDLPLPEVIEKDSDSVWAMWTEAVEDKPTRDADTIPATLLMGLPEFPKDPDES